MDHKNKNNTRTDFGEDTSTEHDKKKSNSGNR
jgi:hypothetical protein